MIQNIKYIMPWHIRNFNFLFYFQILNREVETDSNRSLLFAIFSRLNEYICEYIFSPFKFTFNFFLITLYMIMFSGTVRVFNEVDVRCGACVLSRFSNSMQFCRVKVIATIDLYRMSQILILYNVYLKGNR